MSMPSYLGLAPHGHAGASHEPMLKVPVTSNKDNLAFPLPGLVGGGHSPMAIKPVLSRLAQHSVPLPTYPELTKEHVKAPATRPVYGMIRTEMR